MSLAIANLKEVCRENTIPQEVGRSFIYSFLGAWIWNGGEATEALSSGGACALITFTASALSPVVAGYLGFTHREPIVEGTHRFLIQAGVITTATLVMRVLFKILIDPVIIAVSVIANGIITSFLSRVEAGHPFTIMHPLGFIGSIIQKNVNFDYIGKCLSERFSRPL